MPPRTAGGGDACTEAAQLTCGLLLHRAGPPEVCLERSLYKRHALTSLILFTQFSRPFRAVTIVVNDQCNTVRAPLASSLAKIRPCRREWRCTMSVVATAASVHYVAGNTRGTTHVPPPPACVDVHASCMAGSMEQCTQRRAAPTAACAGAASSASAMAAVVIPRKAPQRH